MAHDFVRDIETFIFEAAVLLTEVNASQLPDLQGNEARTFGVIVERFKELNVTADALGPRTISV